MADLLLVVRLAGRRVAFPAAEVEGVVELEGLTPAPGAAPHVAGLSALRSRVLTVIDGLAALEAGQGRRSERWPMPSSCLRAGILMRCSSTMVEDVVEAASRRRAARRAGRPGLGPGGARHGRGGRAIRCCSSIRTP